MNKLNIFVSTSCLRFTVLFLLIVYVSAKTVNTIANDQNPKVYVIPDISFLFKSDNRYSDHAPLVLNHGMEDDQTFIIPYHRRSIHIERQRALHAHGIIGRRR
ncbi:unnamed protein product [Rotaria socialis]|uniref:Uncharacterized protein n=1 Tax=Rotaria socialis TaxID=392032 RepID=A0A817MWD3_9BILA|nr:unnamed protein product [Rotaria socialis]CAF3332472.1 unnamed protein product [Rotaria socialis]CAF3706722.1 unnamed protein product [Rotaria socialis]CAF3726857.1 unnamed protein product [Rotaria socialis]